WTGIIPVEANRPAQYVWRLDRHGAFAYREHIWEDKPLAVTEGHIHFGAQFNLVVPALFFYRRLAQRCRIEDAVECRVQLDLEGVAGRGMVAYAGGDRALDDFTLDLPRGQRAGN